MITLAKTCTAFGEITILKSSVKGSHIYCQREQLPNGLSELPENALWRQAPDGVHSADRRSPMVTQVKLSDGSIGQARQKADRMKIPG
jgi:hypothetical protein